MATQISQRIKVLFDGQNKERMQNMLSNLQEDMNAIAFAIVFTMGLSASTIIYLFQKFSYWIELGDFVGLYVFANVILLVRFIYIRTTTEWTLDELGKAVFNLSQR